LKLQTEYNIQDIKELLKDDLKIINDLLYKTIEGHSNLIHQVGDHIFSAGGKRIRPVLSILSGKLFNYNSDELYYLATAVELIHSATLLHDDVIDNSELRRGRKTANNLFDNKTSILVGDFLFAESFKLMVKGNSLNALMILSKASSIISEGEVKQLELKEKQIFSLEQYLEVITDKTAILFGAATESSACIAGRSSSECKLLKEFGINLGLAFQIVDDILDYSANDALFGKTIGNDFYEKKITLPIIFLLQDSNDKEQEEIRNIFHSSQSENKHLNYIISLLNNKDIFSKCYDYAQTYIENALKILKNFPSSNAKDILENICYTSVVRKY